MTDDKHQSPTTEALIERLRLHRTWRDSHGELNDAPNEAADALEALSRPSPIAEPQDSDAAWLRYQVGNERVNDAARLEAPIAEDALVGALAHAVELLNSASDYGAPDYMVKLLAALHEKKG